MAQSPEGAVQRQSPEQVVLGRLVTASLRPPREDRHGNVHYSESNRHFCDTVVAVLEWLADLDMGKLL
jgi:hypothetical protein